MTQQQKETAQGLLGLAVLAVVGIVIGLTCTSGDDEAARGVQASDTQWQAINYNDWSSSVSSAWYACEIYITNFAESVERGKADKGWAALAQIEARGGALLPCINDVIRAIDSAPSNCWGQSKCRELRGELRPTLIDLAAEVRRLR